jgi:tetratricopeptide (TPR) repeat protein
MILIPMEFIPCCLLTCEDVSRRSQKLLTLSRQSLVEKRWAEAEQHALAVRDATQNLAGRVVDYAVALIHLADLYRMAGRLGPALAHGEKAHKVLKNQPGPAHYHNRAVSEYALGVTHHELGNVDLALQWYQGAKELFERAIPDWGRRGGKERQIQIDRVARWIDGLIESITFQEEGLTDNPFYNLTWFPMFRPRPGQEGGQYRMARFLVTNRQLDSKITCVDGRRYAILSTDGSRHYSPVLDFGRTYYVVPIEETDGGWDVQEGDLALIVEKSPETQGGDQAELGPWIRGDEGSVRFVGTRARIIGGDEEEAVEGEVVAILRPAES